MLRDWFCAIWKDVPYSKFVICVKVLYLCTVAALRVAIVLGGELTVCVFIGGYAVIVVLVIVNAQVQWI